THAVGEQRREKGATVGWRSAESVEGVAQTDDVFAFLAVFALFLLDGDDNLAAFIGSGDLVETIATHDDLGVFGVGFDKAVPVLDVGRASREDDVFGDGVVIGDASDGDLGLGFAFFVGGDAFDFHHAAGGDGALESGVGFPGRAPVHPDAFGHLDFQFVAFDLELGVVDEDIAGEKEDA